jgi:O-antigen/teichoic acid export membrane protein
VSGTKKNLTNTFLTTGIILILQVINIVLSTQLLGSEGRGQISLYLLHIAIGAQIGSMVGGEALVFFTPRFNLKSLFSLSVQWNAFIMVLAMITFWLFKFSNTVVFLLGSAIFLQSSFQLMTQLGIGNMLITKTNRAFLFSQCIFTLCIFILHFNEALTETSFIVAYMIGLSASMLYLASNHSLLNRNSTLPKITIKKALSNGFVIQLGNVAQTFNSRLSYFLLESLFANGKALVGIYSTALLVSEKALVVPKSLGRVQLAETANETSSLALKTCHYFKLYIALAVVVMLILLFVPDTLYVFVFGTEFEDVGFFIRLLIPAMLLLMGSNAMSNYFSGLGMYKVNSSCTLIALCLSSITAVILIPDYANIGAAISTNVAFAVLCITQCWYFTNKNPDLPRTWLIPNKADWLILKRALTKVK